MHMVIIRFGLCRLFCIVGVKVCHWIYPNVMNGELEPHRILYDASSVGACR